MEDYIFVYRDTPGDTAGLQPLVRAANGESVSASDGFNYETLYGQWVSHYGNPLPAWDYFYPGTHGTVAANVLLDAAPHAAYYVLDVEDPGVDAAELAACVAALSHFAPVYLSTYGQVTQADDRKIPYANAGFAGVMPQIYYDYQTVGITQWAASGLRVYPTFSPADNAGWVSSVAANPVGIWRYGTVNPATCKAAIDSARGQYSSQVDLGDIAMATVDDVVNRVNILARDGHCDEFFKRFLTIRRDLYSGQGEAADLDAIKASLASLVAAAGKPAGAS